MMKPKCSKDNLGLKIEEVLHLLDLLTSHNDLLEVLQNPQKQQEESQTAPY